jgi:hypothetical protein
MTDLLLRRASESRPGTDGQDDYDVIGADGLVIGRISKANRFPNGAPWQWSPGVSLLWSALPDDSPINANIRAFPASLQD